MYVGRIPETPEELEPATTVFVKISAGNIVVESNDDGTGKVI